MISGTSVNIQVCCQHVFVHLSTAVLGNLYVPEHSYTINLHVNSQVQLYLGEPKFLRVLDV